MSGVPEPGAAPVAAWSTLPPTPSLPFEQANFAGHFAVDEEVKLWYATFGVPPRRNQPAAAAAPVIVFLHGGFSSSDYWAHQISHLLNSAESGGNSYTLITIDSRGHGRSTPSPSTPLTYALMSRDILSLMSHLQVPSFSLVGWSDGANTALTLAMTHPSLVTGIFSFAGCYSTDCTLDDAMESPVLQECVKRQAAETRAFATTADQYDVLRRQTFEMWGKYPNWGDDDESRGRVFARIRKELREKIWFVAAEKDEILKRDVSAKMHLWTKSSTYLVLPGVSHFAFMQDPASFNAALDRFLASTTTTTTMAAAAGEVVGAAAS